ncbi:MAG: low specificity L-threonine aldolase [Bdellovibrionaceae bacterium]|nr:low specificity L-threonine aldolase [Pseudobdellovibrionaceae bacterium]
MTADLSCTDIPAKIGFGSDNHSGVHPEIMTAIAAASRGHAPSYGTDEISARVAKLFEREFGPGTQAFFVFNGTAANVLALDACVKPFQAVLCSEHSHIHVDECGAPERWIGAKLLPVPAPDGKVRVSDLRTRLIRRGDQHYSQAAVVSIAQPTELGTVYSLDELRAIAAFTKEQRLLFHIDGARLVNAAEYLGCSLRELTRDVGVDVLSFGGTKNGLLFGEAVVFFREDLAQDFKYRRKQAMQLPSKTRFVAAQFEAWLGTDLWLRTARHANSMARRLAAGLQSRSSIQLTQLTQANGVFVRLPKSWIAKLRARAFFYVWNELDSHSTDGRLECRLMTTFDTTPAAIDDFLATIDELSQSDPQNQSTCDRRSLDECKS